MREVTRKTVSAFLNGRKLTNGNTSTDGKKLYLHGNCIAKRENGNIYVNNCGWETTTTKERINGVFNVLGRWNDAVYQKNFVWYYKNGVEFPCDEWVKVI